MRPCKLHILYAQYVVDESRIQFKKIRTSGYMNINITHGRTIWPIQHEPKLSMLCNPKLQHNYTLKNNNHVIIKNKLSIITR